MAAHDKVRWHPPLKAPAVEVFDLLSDSDSIVTPLESEEHVGKRDAYDIILGAQEPAVGDVQWRAPLKAPAIGFDDSLPQDISTGTGEALVHGEEVKACDASAEESDSDEDSQWSLYEDALGGDEDEVALQSSM